MTMINSRSGQRIDMSNIDATEHLTEAELIKAYPLSDYEHYEEEGISRFLDDLNSNLIKASTGDIDAAIEKGKKDISKLTKKTITDKLGRTRTVYVKRHEVGRNHDHPSQKHAEAVHMYNTKKKYMSKDNAKAHVARHVGEKHADYAHMHVSTGKTDTAKPKSQPKKESKFGATYDDLPDNLKIAGIKGSIKRLTGVSGKEAVLNDYKKELERLTAKPEKDESGV